MNPFQPQTVVKAISLLLGSFITAVILTGITPTALNAQGVAGTNVAIDAPTIIGGEEVTENIYPWTVALIKAGSSSVESRQFCGGTLIAPEWVVTAAHCTYRGSTPRTADSFTILAGTTTLDPEAGQVLTGTTTLLPTKGEQIAVSQIIRHPDYVRATANADVALIRLAAPVAYPTINLADAAQLSPEQRAAAHVLGWGKTEDKSRSTVLRQVNVPLVDWETCRASYATFSYLVTDNMICAGYPLGGKDACTGDSGGPLVAPSEYNADGTVSSWALIGVVSWGRGCAQINAYGVYTNIGVVSSWIATERASVDAKSNPVGGVSLNSSFIFLPVVQ